MSKKTITGKIISTNGETAKVLTKRLKNHPKYQKKYEVTKKYLVHNPKGKFKVDMTVEIEETKPISKRKRFIIKQEVK